MRLVTKTPRRTRKVRERDPGPLDYLERPVTNSRDARIWLEGLEYFFLHSCSDCDDWAIKVRQCVDQIRALEIRYDDVISEMEAQP